MRSVMGSPCVVAVMAVRSLPPAGEPPPHRSRASGGRLSMIRTLRLLREIREQGYAGPGAASLRHDPILVPAGRYEIRRQRDYLRRAARFVAD